MCSLLQRKGIKYKYISWKYNSIYIIPVFSIVYPSRYVSWITMSGNGILQIVGYKSYAEYCMQLNLSSSPDVVHSFLLKMSKLVRPMADEVWFSTLLWHKISLSLSPYSCLKNPQSLRLKCTYIFSGVQGNLEFQKKKIWSRMWRSRAMGWDIPDRIDEIFCFWVGLLCKISVFYEIFWQNIFINSPFYAILLPLECCRLYRHTSLCHNVLRA